MSPLNAAPAPTTPKVGKPPLVWIGVLLVVLLGVGAFIWGGGKGSHVPSAPTAAAALASATTAPAALSAAFVPEMVKVPAGPFLMGSNSTEVDNDFYNELPSLVMLAYPKAGS